MRGIESPDRKFIVKKLINIHSNLYCLMPQEVKVVGFSLDLALYHIWKDDVKFVSNHPKGKGGVVILVHSKWAKLILNSGTSPCNRVSWVIIKDNDAHFGICTVYASNDYKKRIQLWKWMTSLPNIP